MTKEPTILIKKSDGSTERLTLSDFNKLKKTDDLLVLEETHLATSTPVKEIFENEAEAKIEYDQDFHKSLLEEDFSEIEVIEKNKTKITVPSLVMEKEKSASLSNNNFNEFIKKQDFISNPKNDFKIDKKIQDIEAPEFDTRKRTMGPVEEILVFSLEDYNRLSSDSQKANEMILAKFENIKKESFLIFINFVKAWKKSPLYKLYLKTCLGAFKNKQTIKEFCSSNAELSYEKFLSLVDLNKKIKI